VPFYARISRLGDLYHTDDWAAIVFYRPPKCKAAGFNLLDFYDIPAAVDCTPLTTGGFEIWANGPSDSEPAPKLPQLHGLGAVPVWFVAWPALESAVGDDLLTIGELSSLEPLVGSAGFFQEVLRPWPAVKDSTIELNASGQLEDGRSLRLHIRGAGEGEMLCATQCVVQIVFN
jgi:hypothetical protein